MGFEHFRTKTCMGMALADNFLTKIRLFELAPPVMNLIKDIPLED